jgi:asparagine synthase (glutamine-hydrolysing)
MCGVCGIIRWAPGDGALDRVVRMRGLLEHRGPDDVGTVEEGGAVFGATRLAIRGAEAGHQPVRDPETGVVVVCNGEIDNHRALRDWLRSRGQNPAEGSDVAILPALYRERGERFIEELEGPFALALWDPRNETLLLARDRVGERPLFYAEREGEMVFATELSALATDARSPLAVDGEALRYYLRFGRFAAPDSPLKGVRKVAPSETVCFDGSGIRRRRYWQWPVGTAPRVDAAADAFDAIFREAVRRQTDCDADYGIFLSGGVDSSLVAAVARSLSPERPLPAYTLRFEEASYDEGAAAAEVAERLGLESTAVWVRAADFPGKIRELVRLVGEPLADPAWVPTALLAQRAARDVKVVLVGEGGDEVFGGYPTYIGALLARSYGRLPSVLRRAFARLVRRWPPSDRKVTLSFLLKRFVDGEGMEPLARHLLWTSSIPPALLERLGCSPPVLRDDCVEGELLDILQRYDLENYLAEGLLTKADRASMGWALEPRAPFLDRRVLEFAATVPPGERVRGIETKVFLKRYAMRYLPRSVVHRRKKGLSVPVSAWLRGSLHAWARERLSLGLLEAVEVDTEKVLELLEEHGLRRADHGRALWALLVLTEWLEWVGELRVAPPCG